MLLGGLDHVAYSHLNSRRRALDPFVDFVPVAAVNTDTWVVATATDAPARSLQALAERSRRERLNYASNGEGSTAHLLTARLCKAVGIEAQHVPYKDPWMPDLIAGRVQFVVAPTPAVLPQLRAGRLMALATLTDERLPLPGQPPSMRELGWPDQVFNGGLFLFAPAALEPQAPRLNQWLLEVVALPEIAQRYRDAAIDTTPLDLEQTAAAVRQRLHRRCHAPGRVRPRPLTTMSHSPHPPACELRPRLRPCPLRASATCCCCPGPSRCSTPCACLPTCPRWSPSRPVAIRASIRCGPGARGWAPT